MSIVAVEDVKKHVELQERVVLAAAVNDGDVAVPRCSHSSTSSVTISDRIFEIHQLQYSTSASFEF